MKNKILGLLVVIALVGAFFQGCSQNPYSPFVGKWELVKCVEFGQDLKLSGSSPLYVTLEGNGNYLIECGDGGKYRSACSYEVDSNKKRVHFAGTSGITGYYEFSGNKLIIDDKCGSSWVFEKVK